MWNKNIGTKICRRCKEELPATTEFFFEKICKYKLVDGTNKIAYSLRHICKECHTKKITFKKRLKRCKELNCDIIGYEKWIKENVGKSEYNQKYKWMDRLNMSDSLKLDMKREIRKGYIFTTLEKYVIDRKIMNIERLKEAQKNRCKTSGRNIFNDLPDGYDFYKDVPKMKLKKIINKRPISNASLANWLGLHIKDAPIELLEAKRIVVEMNNFIKNN
jgi:hypothetical protein